MGAVSFNLETPSASLLAGNVGFLTGYEHIESVNVGSGGASSVTFTGIPQYYRHLQIRSVAAQASTTGYASVTFGGKTFQRRHWINGNGSSATSSTDTTNAPGIITVPAGTYANIFGASIMDILDYSSTVKNTTVRALGGKDANDANGGGIWLFSALYTDTSAISSITISAVTNNFVQHSTFSLYGIR